MLMGAADETPYDLRFRLLGVPIRVHPLFWLVMAMISGFSRDLKSAAVFALCAFVSVLVHEFGHGLSSRFFGSEPRGIVLYAMGGYCLIDVDRLRPSRSIVVLLCGPGFGFALAALVIAFGQMVYGIHPLDSLALVGIGSGTVDTRSALLKFLDPRTMQISLAGIAYYSMLYINIWWGFLNLLPIFPLDGGRIATTGLGIVNRRDGVRWGHTVSLVTAGAIALYFGTNQEWYAAAMFGYFAYMNYQILESLRRAYHGFDDQSS